MKGSRNHLRSFVRNIEQNGNTYSAQYLKESDYSNIVNSDIEKSKGQQSGQGNRSRSTR